MLINPNRLHHDVIEWPNSEKSKFLARNAEVSSEKIKNLEMKAWACLSTFSLERDIMALNSVWQIAEQAQYATILYCKRIVEATAFGAVTLGCRRSDTEFKTANLDDCINRLSMEGYLKHEIYQCANRLISLCSYAHTPLLPSHYAHDWWYSVVFLKRWLDWYFCDFPAGLCLPCITRDDQPIFTLPEERELAF